MPRTIKSEKQRENNRLAAIRFAALHPDRAAASKQAYQQRHPERCAASRLRWKGNNREIDAYVKRKYALKKYGITPEDYDVLFSRQNGLCAICKSTDRGKFLAVDHCHTSGKVRGLLCRKCNVGIAPLDGNPGWLDSALRYLEAA